MVKFKSGKLLVFGLSEETLKLLKANKPSSFKLKEIGLDNQVLIFYGVTENHMKNMLKKYLGNDTKIIKSKKYFRKRKE